VRQFGQRLGGFDRQAVQIKVLCEVAGLEELRRLAAGLVADGNNGEADHVALRGRYRLKVIGNRNAPALRLARESDALQLALRVIGIKDD
jgi:hypothetical protein